VLFLTDLCCAIGPTKTNLISRVGNFWSGYATINAKNNQQHSFQSTPI
jgi:hypothetical protein